jgi:hypothetical protein
LLLQTTALSRADLQQSKSTQINRISPKHQTTTTTPTAIIMSLRGNLLLLATIVGSTQAFAPQSLVVSKTATRPAAAAVLRMADKKEGDVTFVQSVFKKEIAYDEKSGRFFETGFSDGDCIPEEEYCVLDKDSGELIRLTIEEKERIFLDALQVCNGDACSDMIVFAVQNYP